MTTVVKCIRLAAVVATLSPLAVLAGSFQVSPVRVHLTPFAPTAAITVRNESTTEDVVIQTRAADWRQENGEDVYNLSNDLIATPPIFTLKPGASQTVRVGLRKTVQTDVQQTFRLYLTEVPPPPKPGFQGLQVALNIGIPIFIAPLKPESTLPSWRARITEGGKLILTGSNPANAHFQILEVSLFEGEPKELISTLQTPKYILGRQSVSWEFSLLRAARSPLRMSAKTDAGNIEAAVEFDAISGKR